MANQRKITNSKKSFLNSKNSWSIFLIFFIVGIIISNKKAILYYFSFKTNKVLQSDLNYKARNEEVLKANNDKIVGIDVSHYQGNINWSKVEFVANKYPIEFVFIRATQGTDKKDSQFENNWEKSKKYNFFRGAYHYYRPNENSLEQAENFIKTVKLSEGDLPPVLDIEKMPKTQSIDNLKLGLHRFLDKIEAHYHTKPIIYSGEKYYEDFLKDEFSDYVFWIANYNFIEAEINPDYQFWQFTEQGQVKGISEKVDINIFNGNFEDLRDLRID